MLHSAGAHASRVCPASVLVAVWNEQDRSAANLIANTLRSRGIAADVAPTAAKLGKQIKYADKLGIPYVWFPAGATDGDDTASDEVKNIVTGDQQPADPKSVATGYCVCPANRCNRLIFVSARPLPGTGARCRETIA